MLAHPTLDRLNAMGLTGMARTFDELAANGEAEQLSHAQWLGLLLDREWSWRYDRKLATRLRSAKLRHQAALEDVDYRSERGLDRALFLKLIAGDWIDAHDNLAICGPSGVATQENHKPELQETTHNQAVSCNLEINTADFFYVISVVASEFFTANYFAKVASQSHGADALSWRDIRAARARRKPDFVLPICQQTADHVSRGRDDQSDRRENAIINPVPQSVE